MPLYISIYVSLFLGLSGEPENLLILQKENLTRLIRLLGDRPMLFGSSRKRFLGAILKKTAVSNPLGDVVGDCDRSRSIGDDITGVSIVNRKIKERVVSTEELDWATAATTAAAVIGKSKELSSSCPTNSRTHSHTHVHTHTYTQTELN